MQIQPSWAANAAAGNISQAASKDRSSGGAPEAAHIAATAGVERVAQSEAANADRDAQGGGQHLGQHGGNASPDELTTTDAYTVSDMPVLPIEPPGELDIIG